MPKGDFTKTKEFIIPLRGVVRDGQLAALLDQSGQEIGMPVTAVESVTGGIGIPLASGKQLRANPRLRPVHYSCFASTLANVDNSSAQSNYAQAIMLPVKFSAIRIGYPHLGGNGALAGMKSLIAATDDIGDLTYTNTAACKKFITPMRSGVEKNSVAADGWQAVTWGGAATASASDLGTDNIDIAWSDLIPVEALPLASDPTNRFAGYYPLLVRIFAGTGYFSRSSYAGFSDPTKFLAECGAQVVLGASRSGGDFVGTPAGWAQAATPAFSDSAVLPIIIEAYAEGRKPTVLFVGDSRLASAPSTESSTYAYRTLATKVEQAAMADGLPLKLLRCCQGGKGTAVYYQRASKILAHSSQPNVSVYLGYSINDGSPTAALLAAAKARVLQHVDQCIQLGITPVILSIFPATGGLANIADVAKFETFCGSLGVPCLSPLAIYGTASGDWANAADHSDNDHLSASGYTDLAARVYELIKPYF